MSSCNKENTGAAKLMPIVYFDPENNDRNAWRKYKCVRLLLFVLLLAFFCARLTYCVSLKLTFGRWSYKDGKVFLVAGLPPPSERKQPALELFSWKRFVENGKDVRIVM
jgi:uncharacterized integral membrane protein